MEEREKMVRLVVVMPAYNEAALIERALERFEEVDAAVGVERVVVVVDDGSTDGTGEIAEGFAGGRDWVWVIRRSANGGKGDALRAGFAWALGEGGADIVLVHDADLEYDVADHGGVLAPILEGRADAVIGSRFIGRSHRVLYYWHAVANRLITTASNMATNLNLTDIECCTKVMTREVASQITVRERGFGVEPELVAKIARARVGEGCARVYEVAVTYAGRTYEEGKKIGWKDGMWAVVCIARYWAGGLRKEKARS